MVDLPEFELPLEFPDVVDADDPDPHPPAASESIASSKVTIIATRRLRRLQSLLYLPL